MDLIEGVRIGQFLVIPDGHPFLNTNAIEESQMVDENQERRIKGTLLPPIFANDLI